MEVEGWGSAYAAENPTLLGARSTFKIYPITSIDGGPLYVLFFFFILAGKFTFRALVSTPNAHRGPFLPLPALDTRIHNIVWLLHTLFVLLINAARSVSLPVPVEEQRLQGVQGQGEDRDPQGWEEALQYQEASRAGPNGAQGVGQPPAQAAVDAARPRAGSRATATAFRGLAGAGQPGRISPSTPTL